MSLAAFKRIFWWEWAHRFLGRFIGVAFLVPFLVLPGGRAASRARCCRGWSASSRSAACRARSAGTWCAAGLADRIDVSQYRLAAAPGARHRDLRRAAVGGAVARRRRAAAQPAQPARRRGARRSLGAGVRADPARRAGGGPEGRPRLQHLAADGRAARPRRPRRHAALVSEPVRERDDRAVQPSHDGLRAAARGASGTSGRVLRGTRRSPHAAARRSRWPPACCCRRCSASGPCWRRCRCRWVSRIRRARRPCSRLAVWHLYAVRHARSG